MWLIVDIYLILNRDMILSSRHSFKEANIGKHNTINDFINEYRRVCSLILDVIWLGYKDFNPSLNQLELPKYLDYNDFGIETCLSARAMSSLVTQLSGVIRSSTEKQRKRIYMLDKKKNEGISKNKMKPLILKLKQNIPQKPNVSNINPELSSKCIEFIHDDRYFDSFIKLKAVIKNQAPIYIPIKNHRHSNSLKAKGVLMGSISLSKKGINLRYDIDEPVKKDIGRIIGADQGMVDVLTMSDAQVTLQTDIHGHSLKSILNRLVNKKKGSKSFKRTQDQRTNFINWSINRLDFSGIKQINLERIVNIGYKNGSSRLLSHWTNTVIRDKIEKRTMLEGVLLIEQDSTYRSQRCHCCSMVRKANRKGKTYSCNSCGFIGDADLNAAMNHEINIPEIPYTLRIAKYNRAGFYWTKDGFYDLAGSSLESLPHV